MPVKLFVDGEVFEHDGNLGIWRYYYEILRRLSSITSITLWLRSKPTRPLPAGVTIVQDAGRLYFPRYDVLSRIRRSISRVQLPKACRHADIFQTTFLSTNPCPSIKEVFTVYDFIAERYFSISGSWAEDYARAKQERIRAATRILCISEATAADLRFFYPEAASRTRVIPLGSEHLATAVQSSNQQPPSQEQRYVLFVGQRFHHKNFVTLLEAMNCPRWPVGVVAHVVGLPFTFAEQLLIDASRLKDRVRHLGRLSDVELRQQYQSAIAFIYPSLYEGFGLPVLEAQANGAPALLSDIPVFHEVAGADGAVFFDPRLPDQLADAVAAIMDIGLRKRLIEAGHANVNRFSWDRCAKQTLAVYEEVAALARS